MEVGEEYLQVKIVGHDFITAFPNKEKSKANQPDFKADGIAVWVKAKKAKEDKTEAKTIKPAEL